MCDGCDGPKTGVVGKSQKQAYTPSRFSRHCRHSPPCQMHLRHGITDVLRADLATPRCGLEREFTGPLALSRRKQGFESPRERQ